MREGVGSMATEERSGDTATAILDVAERLVQQRGFNGFSYADVARELGVTKAALHYHFPGKAELGEQLVQRYGKRFAEALQAITDAPVSAAERLADYCEVYRRVLLEGRMCLCGMLAADYDTLAEPMRAAVARFFEENEAWVAGLLEQGQGDGSLVVGQPVVDAARTVIAALEGAMLVARPFAGAAVFDAVVGRLLADFVPGAA
jgi:TetR/AcrR family transcriptional regulator, transcriptional repressor for nem operon